MDKKIIDASRYKKISRSKLKKKRKSSKKIDLKNSSVGTSKTMLFSKNKNIPTNVIAKRNRYDRLIDNTVKEEKKEKTKERIKKKISIKNMLKVAGVVIGITLSVIGIKFLLSGNRISIKTVFSDNESKNEELVSGYNLNIGISKLDTTDYLKSSNIILNEIINKTKTSLVKMNKDYKLEYILLDKIDKESDLVYTITLNQVYKQTVEDVISEIEKIKKSGESNIYFSNVSNIKTVEKLSDIKLKIELNNKDPFFVYKLNFPISSNDTRMDEYTVSETNSDSILLKKNTSKSTLDSIKLKNYQNTDDMVEDFRNGNIDVFTASSDNIMQLIGKREYNVKKYRDGETVFLLGNKDSLLFKRKEVRQAIAYSINRDEIVKNIDMKFSEVIDLPYIYSDIKYKYDLYAAENVLLLEGWKKTGGIYNKNEGYEYKKIELNLLVNADDETKCKIADSIKEMVEKIGIRINVLKLSEQELQDKIINKDYDLVLSTIYINDNPDISFLYDYINVDDITNSAIENLNNSNIDNIQDNLNNLKDVLSQEVACIGILAKNTNVVYQKYITGFDNISYFKVFENINNIGKIKE